MTSRLIINLSNSLVIKISHFRALNIDLVYLVFKFLFILYMYWQIVDIASLFALKLKLRLVTSAFANITSSTETSKNRVSNGYGMFSLSLIA